MRSEPRTFVEVQEQLASRRCALALLHPVSAWRRGLSLAPYHDAALLTASPLLVGLFAAFWGVSAASPELLLALPVAWFQLCRATGALSLFDLVPWALLALVGGVLGWVWSPALVLLPLGAAFMGSAFACSAGLGITALAVREQALKSPSAWASARETGVVVLVERDH